GTIHYWLKKEKIPLERLLVVVDDVSIPFGSIRIRPKGGDAGHNGLANINQVLGTSNYPRLRFGIGNDFPQGAQVNYVLSEWSTQEEKKLPELAEHAAEMIKAFGTIGLELTMNHYNIK
ncbi:MAG: aminoacyl-tRNA hydrolase, partial [Bacteroidales bacterium]|nr:aminoacyl-tRNA hydrolase [Bacteroidales bacterium]